MKRLSLIGSWKRIGVQVGLLAGIGIAFAGGVETRTVVAAPENCKEEGNCTFKKPLFGIILDNSSSMNEEFDANTSRWEGAVEAIKQMVAFDNGYIAENFILGLVRYGHDPEPNIAGTKIAADTSGLVDGQKLDVPWYDAAGPDQSYIECTNGDAIIAALDAVGAPSGGNTTGIGTWTKGAMDFVAQYIATSKADHPEDDDKRAVVLMVVTDGAWTNPQGNMQEAPANQDPKITAGALWNMQQIPTYVVALGAAEGKAFADELAAAGGTMAAIDAANPQALIDALKAVIVKIQEDVVAPVCTPGLPRVMVLLDASSSMLNINNGTLHAPAGMGGWDQARDALTGANSIFDVIVNGNQKVENLVHLGMAVFGHNMPAEEKLIVQYGPCRKDNFDWALNPQTSCVAPGCVDPYAKAPIEWTFLDGSVEDPPGFDSPTLSHMPQCDFSAQSPNACIGSGTYTHLGLNLIQQNITDYKAECSVMGYAYPCSDATEYINILITDGKYNSTDPQVQMPLESMYQDDITTYVIGFGDAVDVTQLNKMADWGSGSTLDYYDANNQDALEMALADIIEGLTFDECCQFNDCAQIPEPTTEEPDPMVVSTESDSNTDSTEGTTADDTTEGVSATDTTATTDPTTGGDPTGDDTTGNITGNTTGGTGDDTTAGETANVPTTGGDTPTGGGPNTTPATPGGEESGDESGSSGPGVDTTGVDDEGCGCKVDDDQGKTRGLLGTLLTLGMAGFMRRRRRA